MLLYIHFPNLELGYTRLSRRYFCTKKLPGQEINLFLIRLVKTFLLTS